ncbi:uncharacterized protein LOC141856748 [Brevipalpus obovatus]|uniref:uncharacterized protein LOC141856748 n=1 Tax=Brevipalpus obovatus TaxID=246614 RepID=UPI003D9F3F8E
MIPFATCIKFNRKRIATRQANSQQSTLQPNVLESSSLSSIPCSSFFSLAAGHLVAQRRLTCNSICGQTSARRSIHIKQPSLLDLNYYRITDRFLENAANWSFNTFTLNTMTGGHCLSSLLIYLFQKYDFIRIFNLDILNVRRCFRLLEEGYHDTNPYHNSIHAADVAQAMHCAIQEDKIGPFLTPMEKMCALLAAVAHDLDHPGVNQQFLISTRSHLASLYNNFSVLESHHWRSAISCLKESGIFSHFTPSQWQTVRHLLKSLIMATDISQHSIYLKNFRDSLDQNFSIDMTNTNNRLTILQTALKCADLGNSCRPWALSKRWTEQICDEFYRQGDYERQLAMKVTPICDRTTASMGKIQIDFLREMVTPLFKLWDQFLSSKLSRRIIFNLKFNDAHWMSTLTKSSNVKRRHSHESVSEKRHKPQDLSKSLDDIMSIEVISLDELRRQNKSKLDENDQDLPVGKKICSGPNGCGTPSPPHSTQNTPTRLLACSESQELNFFQLNPPSPMDIPEVKIELDQCDDGLHCPAGERSSMLPHSLSTLTNPTALGSQLQDNVYPYLKGRRGSAPGCIGVYTNCELAAALVLLHGAVSETEAALRSSLNGQRVHQIAHNGMFPDSPSSLSPLTKAQKRRSSFPVCDALANGSVTLTKDNSSTASIYGKQNSPQFKGRSLELLMSSLTAKSKLLTNQSCSLDSKERESWINREERRGSIPQDILISSLTNYTAAGGS